MAIRAGRDLDWPHRNRQLVLPATIAPQTASKFRGKDGWFSEREEKIMVNRVLRDDPSKGDMHNRQAIDFKGFWLSITDYHMWPLAATANFLGQYITLVLKGAGFGTFTTNILTIPAYVLFTINLLWLTKLSEKLNERFVLGSISQFWVLPLLIVLECLSPNRSHWVTWILAVLLFAQPYTHAIFVALCSRNAGTVRTRTVASALYNMSVQLSNIIGANIYRTGGKPYYYTSNKALIVVTVYNIVLFAAAKFSYVTVNRRRDKIWSGMSKEEKEHYLATTTDKGNKRLDFRFAHWIRRSRNRAVIDLPRARKVALALRPVSHM